MVARKKLDAQVAALQALRDNPDTAVARAELERGLQSRFCALAAVAANIVANAELRGLERALVDAFERFMLEPEQRDKGCLSHARPHEPVLTTSPRPAPS